MFYLYSLISQTKTHLKCQRGSEMSWFNIKRKWDLRSHQRHRVLAVYCPLEYIILNYQTSLCLFRIECPVSRDVNKGSLLKTRLLDRSWASLGQAAFLPSPLEVSISLLILLALYSSRGNDTPASVTQPRGLILHHRTHGSIKLGPGGTWKGKKKPARQNNLTFPGLGISEPQPPKITSYSESSNNHVKSLQQISWPTHPLSMEAGTFSV